MSTLKVDAIRHNSATSDAITTHSDGTASAKIVDVGGSQLSNRNLQVNGAMIIAQKATTDTGSEGIATVDRFGLSTAGEDEDLTQAQADVASGTTPYSLGFRKAYKITNGNQTSGAGADDRAIVHTTYESQDIANSGWNYTSSTGFVTLSYWAKSSVAQTFYLALTTADGSSYRYATPITFTSANTWTKFTHKIPGNSNLQFDQDANRGLQMYWTLFRGTNTTDNSFTINQWAAYNSSIRYPDITSTWWTTNDSTFELTGVQFEVGDTPTSFEHRTYGDELRRCQRYYEETYVMTDAGNSYVRVPVLWKVEKRAAGTPVSYAKRPDGVGTGAANKAYQANGERDATCNYSWTGGTMLFVTGYSNNYDTFGNIRVDVGSF